jgi:hypothetical protein
MYAVTVQEMAWHRIVYLLAYVSTFGLFNYAFGSQVWASHSA